MEQEFVEIPKEEFRKLTNNIKTFLNIPTNKAAFYLAKSSLITLEMYDIYYKDNEKDS